MRAPSDVIESEREVVGGLRKITEKENGRCHGFLTTTHGSDVGRPNVLDETRKEVLVADVYPAIVVVASEICILCPGMSSLADVNYLSCAG